MRNITQQAIDDASSEDSGDDELASLENRKEMAQWQRFCKEKIEKIEKVWNRKLDEKQKEEEDENSDKDDDEENDFEANMRRLNAREEKIGDILANMPNRRRENVQLVKGSTFVDKSQPVPDLEQAAKLAEEKRAKDDSDL